MRFLPRLAATTLVLVTAFAGSVVDPGPAGATAPGAGTASTIGTADRAHRRAEWFKLASFNVLGASHTGARSGVRRIKVVARMIGSRGVSIAGFQEFEKIQATTFKRVTRGRWGVVSVPRGQGSDTRNAIVYSKARFTLLSKSWLSIPYYGPEVKVPIARLRARRTGKVIYVMNTHNASNAHGPAWRKRREAVRRQVRRLTQMRRKGATVFFTGDMNSGTKVHCAVTRGGSFKAASGGSVGLPCKAPRANNIDWIFGTRDVRFTHWVADRTPHTRRLSDHSLLVVRVRIHR